MTGSQKYYWAADWQEGEQEADTDIAAGRVRRFATVKEAIAWLRLCEATGERRREWATGGPVGDID